MKLTPQPADDPAAGPFGRLLLDKQFHGELEGTSVGQMLGAGTAVEGSAAYVALELFTGTLAGRRGSFMLQHAGTMRRGEPSLTVTVVPDSGTDSWSACRARCRSSSRAEALLRLRVPVGGDMAPGDTTRPESSGRA